MYHTMKARYLLVLFALLVALPQAMNAKKKKEVSIQLYSVRDVINKGTDLNVVLKDLAEMGYTSIEAANYDNGKFYGKTPEEFKSAVEKAGMTVLSSHCSRGLSGEEVASGDFSESLKWWDQSIAAHKAAGMKYIVNPGIGVPKTMKEMKMYCDYFNEIGKRCQQNGMKFGYHNHAHEFQKVEDKAVMLDYMIENTNPEYVFFQMDVYWIVRELGQSGMVGFDAIFNNAKTAGVKNIVAEIEDYSCPVMESVKKSIDYLLEAPFVKASYSK